MGAHVGASDDGDGDKSLRGWTTETSDGRLIPRRLWLLLESSG